MSTPGDDYTPETAPEASSSALVTETEGSMKDQRLAKMNQLRRRMQESSQANRKDAIQESTVRKLSAQESARLERKRKIAEALGEQIEAEDSGMDPERKRAWEYTVEDNERWDAKLAKKERRSKFEFTDFDDVARRKYKRDIDDLKVDLKSYNAQRREALGSSAAAGTDLIATEAGSSAVQRANEMLYRDANSFVYADHKPSDEAIDKVVQKLNMEYVSICLNPHSALTSYITAWTSATSSRVRGRKVNTMSHTLMIRTRCAELSLLLARLTSGIPKLAFQQEAGTVGFYAPIVQVDADSGISL